MNGIYATKDDKLVKLNKEEIEERYRKNNLKNFAEKAREYAKEITRDSVRAHPWILPDITLDDTRLDSIFRYATVDFELQSTNMAADSKEYDKLWDRVIRSHISPSLSKNIAPYILEHLDAIIIPNDDAWSAFVGLIIRYSKPENMNQIELVMKSVQQGGLRSNTSHDPDMLNAVNRALSHGDFQGLLDFCIKYLPPHPQHTTGDTP